MPLLFPADCPIRLTSVMDAEGKSTTYKYDSAGRPIELKYPNGISEQYSYDKAGQLLETAQTDKNNVKSVLNSYTYDPMGNIISDDQPDFDDIMVKIETVNNTFNSLNQLTSKTVKDEYGNVTNIFDYTFDKRGNLIKEVDTKNGNATKTYTYDATNKMVKGVNASGESSSYNYNGLGMLINNTTVTKENGSVSKDYVIDYTSYAQSELMAYESNGLNYRYIYGLQKVSASVFDTKTANILKLYIQNDRLGSGMYASDDTGKAAAHTYMVRRFSASYSYFIIEPSG